MKVLFLGYWGIDEPLTKATIFPHLQVLQEIPDVSKIVFVTMERNSADPIFSPDYPVVKIAYHPLHSRKLGIDYLNKVYDFFYFPRAISKLVKESETDVIVARGAPAGALAYLSWRKTGTPFLVESFEPHADYMLESGIWHKLDPRYRFQKKWEEKQMKYAKGLMPVANAYAAYLRTRGLPSEKVMTVPCSVDFKQFHIDEAKKEAMRKHYGVGRKTIVGVYAGKFGGLYLEEKAFKLFRGAFRYFSDFFLIILTPPQFHDWVRMQIDKHGLPPARILIKYVQNRDVASYLALSDFGYATYKPGPFKTFLSPVKLGEYWACGLPVVMTQGVGDESAIIEDSSAGVLFDPNDTHDEWYLGVYAKLDRLLRQPGLGEKISCLAKKLRDLDRLKEAYNHFLFHKP